MGVRYARCFRRNEPRSSANDSRFPQNARKKHLQKLMKMTMNELLIQQYLRTPKRRHSLAWRSVFNGEY